MGKSPQNLKPLALPAAAGLYGLYSAAVSARNIRYQQGCFKCEATRAALGLVLAIWAGATVYLAVRS